MFVEYRRRIVIEVDDRQIRIKGSKDELERTVLASRPAAEPRSQMSTKWRAGRDENENCYLIEFKIQKILLRSLRCLRPRQVL